MPIGWTIKHIDWENEKILSYFNTAINVGWSDIDILKGFNEFGTAYRILY
jgi:hypothetical protein